MNTPGTQGYGAGRAGIWRRLGALVIDLFILAFAELVILKTAWAESEDHFREGPLQEG